MGKSRRRSSGTGRRSQSKSGAAGSMSCSSDDVQAKEFSAGIVQAPSAPSVPSVPGSGAPDYGPAGRATPPVPVPVPVPAPAPAPFACVSSFAQPSASENRSSAATVSEHRMRSLNDLSGRSNTALHNPLNPSAANLSATGKGRGKSQISFDACRGKSNSQQCRDLKSGSSTVDGRIKPSEQKAAEVNRVLKDRKACCFESKKSGGSKAYYRFTAWSPEQCMDRGPAGRGGQPSTPGPSSDWEYEYYFRAPLIDPKETTRCPPTESRGAKDCRCPLDDDEHDDDDGQGACPTSDMSTQNPEVCDFAVMTNDSFVCGCGDNSDVGGTCDNGVGGDVGLQCDVCDDSFQDVCGRQGDMWDSGPGEDARGFGRQNEVCDNGDIYDNGDAGCFDSARSQAMVAAPSYACPGSVYGGEEETEDCYRSSEDSDNCPPVFSERSLGESCPFQSRSTVMEVDQQCQPRSQQKSLVGILQDLCGIIKLAAQKYQEPLGQSPCPPDWASEQPFVNSPGSGGADGYCPVLENVHESTAASSRNLCAYSPVSSPQRGPTCEGVLDQYVCSPSPPRSLACPSSGPVYPSLGPACPSPGPSYPSPESVCPSLGPACPSPAPGYPSPESVYPSTGPTCPSSGPVYPSPFPACPSPGPGYTSPGSVCPPPGPICPSSRSAARPAPRSTVCSPPCPSSSFSPCPSSSLSPCPSSCPSPCAPLSQGLPAESLQECSPPGQFSLKQALMDLNPANKNPDAVREIRYVFNNRAP